ncbi:MAG: methyltransferase domain-containing protein, partial [Actinobacteria bacterium]|nr:methyltransferase domain-containing protein [Actinomycetota bacterium]
MPGPGRAVPAPDRDSLAGTSGAWWDDFFADRTRPVPFFTGRPDENLAEWLAEGLISPGRVLELGCGNGRNAIFLARLGCDVTAVDFSERAIAWATGRARQAGVQPEFRCCSIFAAQVPAGSCDLVYDAGCFHHLPPHRRRDYVRLVDRALRPGGGYGLVCFRPEGGSGYSDQEVYQRGSLGGGLGYPADRLRALWDKPPFSVRVLRRMRKADAD